MKLIPEDSFRRSDRIDNLKSCKCLYLFNDAVSVSDCTVSSDEMISER